MVATAAASMTHASWAGCVAARGVMLKIVTQWVCALHARQSCQTVLAMSISCERGFGMSGASCKLTAMVIVTHVWIGLTYCPPATSCWSPTVQLTASGTGQCNVHLARTGLSTFCACGRLQSVWCGMLSCCSLGHQALCTRSTSQMRRGPSLSFSCTALANMAAPHTAGG